MTKHDKRRICAVAAANVGAANGALQRLDPRFGPNTFSVSAKSGTMFLADIALSQSQFQDIKTITGATLDRRTNLTSASHRR